jgi:VWFA-related protein
MLINRWKRNSIFLSFLAIIGFTIFSFMGCGGSGGGSSASAPAPAPAPTPQPPAEITVSRTQIVFSGTVLDNFSEESLSIQNTGSSSLNIGQIAQANPLSAPFSITSDNCSGKQLTGSQTCTLVVRFSPTSQGEFADVFDIPSNDPTKSSVAVSIGGNGMGLKVSINQLNKDSCPTVKSLITVTDKDANPLSGLPQNNFSLFETGISMPITKFSTFKSPISVALLLDYSGSMTAFLPDVEAASKLFIDLLDPANNDEAAVFKFATTYYLMQSFTVDQVALKAAIDSLFPGNSDETHLYDSLWATIEEAAKRVNMRAIILISDGRDANWNDTTPGSVKTLPEVIMHAKEYQVPIFTIGIGDVDTLVMSQLANETGGEYFVAVDSSQISSIYQTIGTILSGQYQIEYSSPSTGSTPINFEVVVDYNGLQGRASANIPGCP